MRRVALGLIASVALHHTATVGTFDDDFVRIATVCDLQVKLLQRPVIAFST